MDGHENLCLQAWCSMDCKVFDSDMIMPLSLTHDVAAQKSKRKYILSMNELSKIYNNSECLLILQSCSDENQS